VIALGDVSVTGREIAVTHARYALIKTSWHAGIASQSLIGFLQSIPTQQATAFDVPGGSDLRHDAGRRLPAGLNARSV
jgi:hypothetical protein